MPEVVSGGFKIQKEGINIFLERCSTSRVDISERSQLLF